MSRTRPGLVCLLVCLSLVAPAVGSPLPPKNVILLIGDGMGFEQVTAANCYNGGALSFESLPYQGEVTTFSASSSVTDSAASATAMATGHKVYNDVVSMAYPGGGGELETVLEYSRDRGKSTGLVTTTYMTHATPACFGAHEPNRDNTTQIAGDYLNQTRPNVLFGGGANGLTWAAAGAAGYDVVTTAAQLQALDTDAETRVAGLFGSTHLPYEFDGLRNLPHLSEMTEVALDILDNDPDGFFLMVEGGRIDHACHDNDIVRSIHETLEFSVATQRVLDWAAGRTDTMVLVTADHETGGLAVLEDNGPGNYPAVSWSSTNHTGANVPIYAWGANAELVGGVMDNTDLYDLMIIPEPATIAFVALGVAWTTRRRRPRR